MADKATCGGEVQYGYDFDPYWECLRCGSIDRANPGPEGSGLCEEPAHEADKRVRELQKTVTIATLERAVIDAAIEWREDMLIVSVLTLSDQILIAAVDALKENDDEGRD